MKHIVALDVGTSGVKACLFRVEGEEFQLLSDKTKNFSLYSDLPGYAEQEPEEIWHSVCAAIRYILSASAVPPSFLPYRALVKALKTEDFFCIQNIKRLLCVSSWDDILYLYVYLLKRMDTNLYGRS